jgi:hypothetical protein
MSVLSSFEAFIIKNNLRELVIILTAEAANIRLHPPEHIVSKCGGSRKSLFILSKVQKISIMAI